MIAPSVFLVLALVVVLDWSTQNQRDAMAEREREAAAWARLQAWSTPAWAFKRLATVAMRAGVALEAAGRAMGRERL